MKKLFLLFMGLTVQRAFADYSKTCDAKAMMFYCEELWGNFGAAPMCPIGLPHDGKACTRTDDLGMCRRTTTVQQFKTMVDHFYYPGAQECVGLNSADCSAKLQGFCQQIGEGVWFGPEATH